MGRLTEAGWLIVPNNLRRTDGVGTEPELESELRQFLPAMALNWRPEEDAPWLLPEEDAPRLLPVGGDGNGLLLGVALLRMKGGV